MNFSLPFNFLLKRGQLTPSLVHITVFELAKRVQKRFLGAGLVKILLLFFLKMGKAMCAY